MRGFARRGFAIAIVWGGLGLGGGFVAAHEGSLADDADDVRQADRAFVAALAKADAKAAGPMLDDQLAWTSSAGDTRGKAQVLGSLPKPTLGDESGAKVSQRLYGQLGAVEVAQGKVHVLRIWGKRAAGWRLVAYHEVTQRDAPPPSGPPEPTTNECENPCKGVPYTPGNDAEKGILKSWGELETAVLNHDPKAWSPHFLDEFVLISSGGTEPVTKAGRIAQLSRPGIGPAPPQLAADPSARFVAFGDAVVMISQSKPYAGKPAHITRIWVNRAGMWRMAASYQTTIASAPAIVPPK